MPNHKKNKKKKSQNQKQTTQTLVKQATVSTAGSASAVDAAGFSLSGSPSVVTEYYDLYKALRKQEDEKNKAKSAAERTTEELKKLYEMQEKAEEKEQESDRNYNMLLTKQNDLKNLQGESTEPAVLQESIINIDIAQDLQKSLKVNNEILQHSIQLEHCISEKGNELWTQMQSCVEARNLYDRLNNHADVFRLATEILSFIRNFQQHLGINTQNPRNESTTRIDWDIFKNLYDQEEQKGKDWDLKRRECWKNFQASSTTLIVEHKAVNKYLKEIVYSVFPRVDVVHKINKDNAYVVCQKLADWMLEQEAFLQHLGVPEQGAWCCNPMVVTEFLFLNGCLPAKRFPDSEMDRAVSFYMYFFLAIGMYIVKWRPVDSSLRHIVQNQNIVFGLPAILTLRPNFCLGEYPNSSEVQKKQSTAVAKVASYTNDSLTFYQEKYRVAIQELVDIRNNIEAFQYGEDVWSLAMLADLIRALTELENRSACQERLKALNLHLLSSTMTVPDLPDLAFMKNEGASIAYLHEMFNKKLEDDYDILCAGVECLLNQKIPLSSQFLCLVPQLIKTKFQPFDFVILARTVYYIYRWYLRTTYLQDQAKKNFDKASNAFDDYVLPTIGVIDSELEKLQTAVNNCLYQSSVSRKTTTYLLEEIVMLHGMIDSCKEVLEKSKEFWQSFLRENNEAMRELSQEPLLVAEDNKETAKQKKQYECAKKFLEEDIAGYKKDLGVIEQKILASRLEVTAAAVATPSETPVLPLSCAEPDDFGNEQQKDFLCRCNKALEELTQALSRYTECIGRGTSGKLTNAKRKKRYDQMCSAEARIDKAKREMVVLLSTAGSVFVASVCNGPLDINDSLWQIVGRMNDIFNNVRAEDLEEECSSLQQQIYKYRQLCDEILNLPVTMHQAVIGQWGSCNQQASKILEDCYNPKKGYVVRKKQIAVEVKQIRNSYADLFLQMYRLAAFIKLVALPAELEQAVQLARSSMESSATRVVMEKTEEQKISLHLLTVAGYGLEQELYHLIETLNYKKTRQEKLSYNPQQGESSIRENTGTVACPAVDTSFQDSQVIDLAVSGHSGRSSDGTAGHRACTVIDETSTTSENDPPSQQTAEFAEANESIQHRDLITQQYQQWVADIRSLPTLHVFINEACQTLMSAESVLFGQMLPESTIRRNSLEHYRNQCTVLVQYLCSYETWLNKKKSQADDLAIQLESLESSALERQAFREQTEHVDYFRNSLLFYLSQLNWMGEQLQKQLDWIEQESRDHTLVNSDCCSLRELAKHLKVRGEPSLLSDYLEAKEKCMKDMIELIVLTKEAALTGTASEFSFQLAQSKKEKKTDETITILEKKETFLQRILEQCPDVASLSRFLFLVDPMRLWNKGEYYTSLIQKLRSDQRYWLMIRQQSMAAVMPSTASISTSAEHASIPLGSHGFFQPVSPPIHPVSCCLSTFEIPGLSLL